VVLMEQWEKLRSSTKGDRAQSVQREPGSWRPVTVCASKHREAVALGSVSERLQADKDKDIFPISICYCFGEFRVNSWIIASWIIAGLAPIS
jgi:hypothetical protein